MSAAARYTQQLKILEDTFVVKFYSNIAYQHDDDEFESKYKSIHKSEYIVCTFLFTLKAN